MSTAASWILVEGGTPDGLQTAILAHAGIATPDVPTGHRCRVVRIDAERFAVTFDPPAPPYAFTNLIGWLADPRMNKGAKRACGWLTSPGDGTRYYLAPRPGKPGGDTLVGATAEGRAATVFLPMCELRTTGEKATFEREPAVPDGTPVAQFDLTLDSNPDFGNLTFE